MKKELLLLALLFFLYPPSVSFAATLYMEPNQAELKRGDAIVIAVRLDTDEDECVNTVDAVISYSDNIQPVDTSRGDSILTLWIEEPKIDRVNRTITFAGGIPNGYCGRIPGDPRLTNNIVNLLFQSPGLQIGSSESGNDVSIDFAQETRVLLNDGFGTQAQLRTFGSKIALSKEAGNFITNPWQERVQSDTLPPEKFSISIERIPDEYGKYYAIFNTTDKQSGIDHYEIIEEPLDSRNLFGWGAGNAPWVRAVSPYILDDQSLNSTIRVRAVDKAGNEYIAVYVPSEEERTFSSENKIIIITLAAVALLLGAIGTAVVLYLRRRKRMIEFEDDEYEEIE